MATSDWGGDMGPFRWYLRHWYDVGLGVAIAVFAAGVVLDLSVLQQILLLNLAVLFLHEFEEYGWPGGLPTFLNEIRPDGGALSTCRAAMGDGRWMLRGRLRLLTARAAEAAVRSRLDSPHR